MPQLVLGERLQLLQVSKLSFLFLSFLGSIFWNVLLDYWIIALPYPTLHFHCCESQTSHSAILIHQTTDNDYHRSPCLFNSTVFLLCCVCAIVSFILDTPIYPPIPQIYRYNPLFPNHRRSFDIHMHIFPVYISCTYNLTCI